MSSRFQPKTFIAVITASFGDGHNTAAQGISSALNRQGTPNSGALDLLGNIHPTTMQFLSKGYRTVTTHWPSLWEHLYKIADQLSLGDNSKDLIPSFTRKTADYLQHHKPSSVISTYPLYGHLIDRLFGSHQLPFTFITMVTDSKTINRAWLNGTSGHYAVLDQISAEFFLNNGIPKERVHVTGFPVSPLFEDLRPKAKEKKAVHPFKILYIPTTQSDHVGATLDAIKTTEDTVNKEIALTVVMGRHEKRLYRTIQSRAPEGTTMIGWTNKMPLLLSSHHLLIGKAGGASVQEALASSCPMIVDSIIPGQEEGNAELLSNNGAGLIALTPPQIIAQLKWIIEESGKKWVEMRSAARSNGQANAASKVAELALSLSS